MSKQKTIAKKKQTVKRIKYSFYLRSLPYVLIIITILLTYRNVFNYGFHFDDETSILRSETIRSTEAFSDPNMWADPVYRPVTYFSFALNYLYGQLEPGGYHFVNILIHIFVTFLVYILSVKIIALGKPRLPENNIIVFSTGLALLFAVHPIQIMAVTYIAQRAESLTAMFYFITVYLYIIARIKNLKEGINYKVIMLYFAGLSGFYLAVMSKQIAFTLPLVLWFTEFFFIRKENGKKARKYLIISGSVIIAAALLIVVSGLMPREDPFMSRWQYLVTQFRVILIYFRLMLVPTGFNIDHGLGLSGSLSGIYELTGLIVILSLLFVAAWFYKKYPLLSYGILWYFVTISVTSSIIPITDLLMEHRNYLSFFGCSLVFTLLIYGITRRKTISFALIMALIVIVLGIISFERNKDWENNTTIWLSSLKQNPENKRALVYIGRTYVTSNPEKALEYFNKAIETDSLYYHGWLNRGFILFDMGNYPEVVASMRKAHSVSEAHHDYSYFVKGVSNIQIKNYSEAAKDLSIYINRTGGDAETFIYRGEANYYLKRYNLAANDFITAFNTDRSKTGLILNVVECYYRQGNVAKTREYIQKAQALNLKVNNTYLDFAGLL